MRTALQRARCSHHQGAAAVGPHSASECCGQPHTRKPHAEQTDGHDTHVCAACAQAGRRGAPRSRVCHAAGVHSGSINRSPDTSKRSSNSIRCCPSTSTSASSNANVQQPLGSRHRGAVSAGFRPCARVLLVCGCLGRPAARRVVVPGSRPFQGADHCVPARAHRHCQQVARRRDPTAAVAAPRGAGSGQRPCGADAAGCRPGGRPLRKVTP